MNYEVFCPCFEFFNRKPKEEDSDQEQKQEQQLESESLNTKTKISSFPPTLIDHRTRHKIQDLQFCPSCKSVKCNNCTTREILAKFCTHCMHSQPINSTHCNKNCFNCPRCFNHLKIESITQKYPNSDKIKGKDFKFSCKNCQWVFNTGLIEKPTSLLTIIKRLSVDNEGKQFKQLRDYYISRYDYLHMMDYESRLKHKQELIDKFSSLEIAKISKTKTIPKFSCFEFTPEDEQDESNIINERISNASKAITPPIKKLFPVPRELRTKKITSCKKCNTELISPQLDQSSSVLSVKFLKQNSAIQYLPDLTITRLRHYNPSEDPTKSSFGKFVLNFKNILSKEIQINLFYSDILNDFIKYSHPPNTNSEIENNILINLRCTSFKLGPKPTSIKKQEELIKTIPTILLTGYTKHSRIELMTRSPISLANITFSKSKSDTDYYEELGESILDQGVNWCSVLLDVDGIQDDNVVECKIPLFVSVESIQKQNDHNDSCKQRQQDEEELKFGTWYLLNLK